MSERDTKGEVGFERLRSLGLTGWATLVGMLAAIATIAAVVVPAFSDDDSTSPGDPACAKADPWSDADSIDDGLAVVRGPVAGATYAPETKARPTYLNLGVDFPDPERFTVVIFGEDRKNFRTPPEDAYDGREIAVSGEVSSFRGVREIVANHPNDIILC